MASTRQQDATPAPWSQQAGVPTARTGMSQQAWDWRVGLRNSESHRAGMGRKKGRSVPKQGSNHRLSLCAWARSNSQLRVETLSLKVLSGPGRGSMMTLTPFLPIPQCYRGSWKGRRKSLNNWRWGLCLDSWCWCDGPLVISSGPLSQQPQWLEYLS